MIPRLFVTQPLAAGARLELDSAQAHYLRNVLRLAAGATVKLFNGRDGEWQATLAESAKRSNDDRLKPAALLEKLVAEGKDFASLSAK